MEFIKELGRDKWSHKVNLYRCSCGGEAKALEVQVRSGIRKSCGCRRGYYKHGHSVGATSRTYNSWMGMIQRCENSRHTAFKNYGGRGIRICARWHQFENFLGDMGERPPDLTLDRIDVNGNYTPDNCRWATWKAQGSNRRKHLDGI